MPIGTYTPPPLAKSLHKFFFHFRCILLQKSHKQCFFISISILGRSGVNSQYWSRFMNKRVGLVFDEKTHCFQSYNQGYRKTGNY